MGDAKNAGLINVDLQPLADVVNNVIDKFSQAVGWYARPRGERKDFEIALEQYIAEIQSDPSLNSLVKAAKISSARKDIKEYVNMQDILQHAQEFGCFCKNDEEPLDEDWAMFFYDRAKNISCEEAKILWGKVLAQECNVGGSIPKQLIQTMSLMSKEDAELFNKVCGFCVERLFDNIQSEKMLLVDMNDSTGFVIEQKMNSSAIVNLEALGLVKLISTGTVIGCEGNRNVLGLRYHGININIHVNDESVSTGNLVFTKSGALLAELIEVPALDGFLDYVKNKYEKENCIVELKK